MQRLPPPAFPPTPADPLPRPSLPCFHRASHPSSFCVVVPGQVLLDGVDVRDLNVRWLRAQIGYVGQEPVLFAGSIAANVVKGRADTVDIPLRSLPDIMREGSRNDCFPCFMKFDDARGGPGGGGAVAAKASAAQVPPLPRLSLTHASPSPLSFALPHLTLTPLPHLSLTLPPHPRLSLPRLSHASAPQVPAPINGRPSAGTYVAAQNGEDVEAGTVRPRGDTIPAPPGVDEVPGDVVDAAIAANAHSFISGFTEGYRTDVGEQSSMVSGGQKQRIAIARALIKRPAVLLLDEATSALDAASEKVVQASIDALASSKTQTTIIIAHRLTTIVNADKIVVIDGGRVVEEGTHDELLLRRNGLYAMLWAKQQQTTTTSST